MTVVSKTVLYRFRSQKLVKPLPINHFNSKVFDTAAMLDEILSCLLMMAFNYYNYDEYRLLLMALSVFIEYY